MLPAPRQVLENWLKKLDGRWDVPISIGQVSAALGVVLVLGDEGLRESLARGGSVELSEAVARTQTKDGLFVPASKPCIYLAGAPSDPDALTERQRFTWAHELAHFLLWKTTGFSSAGNYWHIERDCNWFASLLLVPDRALEKIVGRPSRAWLGSVREVMAACRVSWPVAAGRMTMFSGGKIVFLRGRLLRPAGQEWRIEITYSSAVAYTGDALGAGSKIKSFVFTERCRLAEEGKVIGTKLHFDIGQLKTNSCFALVRRRNENIEMMVRVAHLPPDPVRSSTTGVHH
ncbi:MAG TPA: ImmA/IrrE family metallo-endopeptidase [Fimbriimonadaceae bacterium]|nr:ImmA/IrrE family metallo-endopeptidase [Fimbriimonadaceae bacterium]